MNTKRILIVEDDSITRKLLHEVLEKAGYQVTSTGDAPDALAHMQRYGLPHLVIVDLGLPTMHGFTLSEQIKKMGDVPIVILTGETSDDAKLFGLQQYAEDYITKPFNAPEVVVRIQRILSRLSMEGYSYIGSPVVVIDDSLSIDFPNNRIMLNGEVFSLTPIETRLLHILVVNRPRVVPTETLLSRVWPNEMQQEQYEEKLRVHMSRLRAKLQQNKEDENRYIYTERGLGYSFRAEDD